jgi:hypothetical protein
VNTKHLLREIVRRIIKYKIAVIVAGIILACLFFLTAKRTKAEYTSKSTVFPLTNPSDNALTSGTLSTLLGISDAPKSFSGEASINIIELALSRNVREAVSAARIPEKGNKMVAELLAQEINTKKSFFEKKILLPNDSASLVVLGEKLLMPNIAAKINKNGVLELYFSSTDSGLVQPISEMLISKISQFYIDLRIAKASADYNFTLLKIDSIQKVIDEIDRRAINLQNTTLFTPAGHLEYDIPKENLGDEKLRAGHEKDISVNNREEALWRLQKATPIIATLDRPHPPFDVQKPSAIIYSIIGFVLGSVIAALILISGLLFRFVKSEIHKTIFSNETEDVTNVA